MGTQGLFPPTLAAALAALAAGVLVTGGCSDPTGVVISVRGAKDAKELWLGVGEKANGSRYLPADETGRLPHQGPFDDGFEIYLSRAELLAQGQVPLVLDAITQPGAGPVDILRATYLLKADANELVEVQMAPTTIGPGRWVCYGQAGERDGFTIADGPSHQDCDRDGWGAEDPDDADPLSVPRREPPPMGENLLPGLRDLGPGCGFDFGAGIRRLPADFDGCGSCLLTELSAINTCLESGARVRCSIQGNVGAVKVSTISDRRNPDWELVRLWPWPLARVNGYFAPSNEAPGDWSVIFSRTDALITNGWFLLTDRALSAPVPTVVRVEFGDNKTECKEI